MPPRNLPSLWPPDVAFLTAPNFSKHVSAKRLQSARGADCSSLGPLIPSRLTVSKVKIIKILDKSHPAFGQCGLFASQHLPANSFVLFYLGHVHGPEDTNEHSNYDLSLDREAGLSIDAASMGNEARFINDYRRISSHNGPNAEFRDCHVDVGNGRLEKRIGVFVLPAGKSGKKSRGIAKGEEILVSYGKGFWNSRLQSS